MVKNSSTDYKIAIELVKTMEMGEKRTIDMPAKVELFRHYLTLNGKMQQKSFRTKKNGDKLTIQRVEALQI